MAYTAEEFDQMRRYYNPHDVCASDREIIEAALRIASAVMRPGVIETAMSSYWDIPVTEMAVDDEAAAIRAALTDAKP